MAENPFVEVHVDKAVISILRDILAVMERMEAKLDALADTAESVEVDLDGMPVPKPDTWGDVL